jgi:hypothetical protein
LILLELVLVFRIRFISEDVFEIHSSATLVLQLQLR